MSLLSKIRGTIETIFQFGIGGPQLKNNAGSLDARNAADNAFVNVRGADPVADDDLATKRYVDSGPDAGGRLLSTELLTSASGILTTGPNTHKLRVRGVGAGGGGGGAAAGVGAASCASGGGAGAPNEAVFDVTPNTDYHYTCGAAGLAGNASGTSGGNGGDSTFTVGSTTVTAPGGEGGGGSAGSTTPFVMAGGIGGTSTSANGLFNSTSGAPGGMGIILTVAGPVGIGGFGGSSEFGGGGAERQVAGPGATSEGFGYGGGGALAGASSGFAGAAGGAGAWIADQLT